MEPNIYPLTTLTRYDVWELQWMAERLGVPLSAVYMDESESMFMQLPISTIYYNQVED